MNGKLGYWLLGAVFAVLMMLANMQLSQINQSQLRLEERVSKVERSQAVIETLLTSRTLRKFTEE